MSYLLNSWVVSVNLEGAAGLERYADQSYGSLSPQTCPGFVTMSHSHVAPNIFLRAAMPFGGDTHVVLSQSRDPTAVFCSTLVGDGC